MDVLIIGGGAAGLTAATTAAKAGCSVTLLERNSRPARKVMITGKGRCNVTNDCAVGDVIANTPGNGRFLYSALTAFPPQAVMQWMEEQGVPLKVERGNRVFPVSDKAVDIVDALVKAAKNAGVRFVQGRATALRLTEDGCRGAVLEDGRVLEANCVAVCTGGASYPQTGSTGDGYTLARQAGHTVVPLRPSLVPLVTDDAWSGQLQGLSLKNCGLTVRDNRTDKVIYEDLGEMLFTHFGMSGPLILSASAHMREMEAGRYTLYIDWKPGLTAEQLDARLLRDFEQAKNSDFANALGALLPRKVIPLMVELSGIAGDTKCHSITRQQRARFGELLKRFPVSVAGFRPISEAIVTAGGVSVKEVEAKTMHSKLLDGLFFAGEVLDIDAYTGGFNLQIAFATGAAAGRAMAEYNGMYEW